MRMCDRCGSSSNVESYVFDKSEVVYMDTKLIRHDICDGCFEDISTFMQQGKLKL